MNIVIVHDGSVLGRHILDAWNDKHSSSSEWQLMDGGSVDDWADRNPQLVVLALDGPSEFEQQTLRTCRDLRLRTLPVLGRGSTVLVGPLETPDVPGCATCLQLRWDNTFERSLLRSIFQLEDDVAPEPLEVSAADLVTLGSIVTDEIVSILSAAPDIPNAQGKVGVYEPGEPFAWIPLVPSHDCPRCQLVPDDLPALAALRFTSHRIHDVEALRVGTVDCEHLETLFVHDKVGYISAMNAYWNGERYAQANAYIYTPLGAEISGYGAGLSLADAKRSALLEVLERSCGFHPVNRRPVVRGSYAALQADALHPASFGLHSQAVYQSPHHPFEPFDEEKPYSWVWAYSTKQQRPILVPEQLAYYGPVGDQRFVQESSNGCAIGGTMEEAVLHGIFEVLERDGFLNMWYAKLPVPELRLGADCPAKVSEVFDYVVEQGFAVRLFCLSHDLRIPAVGAVAVHSGNDYPKVVSGSACHIHPYEAAYGALRELAVGMLNLQRTTEERREEARSMFQDSSKIKGILDHAAVAGLPEAYPRWAFLLRRAKRGPLPPVDAMYPDVRQRYCVDSRDIRLILEAVLEDLHGRGFDVIVVHQTSAEVAYGGFQVAKVLIPGMTPMTFGYGLERVRGLRRVFELPHRMGYAARVLTEQDLNGDCHPFS
ncbi:TOMM precursor leader peptide-binding protein [Alicyclobacillus cycloheptanicus]|uniref:Ribosomal protein S12 methylthiotransferase accessory factor n=1 Tax=Alicyclobacillus cycloheptanicus TaxID=1457 RepID=A0ABT9XJI5_9BACL|nr:TOMM precursor leader peptide-binding protein [Alicyclobacillus cycloheptanicus]MDQ0190367.1 ribosomal protein S12 methylthiotransferase accessory factor [Alicyclobacillus cycloheptanicus]WDL99999.1 TOMM precursor leader peptide-binding protein [Alicyclobacillus cycloheptanicus]